MTTLKLQLEAPIRSVKVINGSQSDTTVRPAQSLSNTPLNTQLSTLCSALQQAITDFQQLHENLFLSHKEQIIRLSIEIAGKILAKDIREQRYEINNIISNALNTVEVSGDITIRLNPEDLKEFQQAIENKSVELPEKAVFIDDPVVNRAECIIETNEGIVECLIHEHLLQIENALLEMQAQTENHK